jgi:predicted Zn finger-like uncharacterized protein
MALSLVYYSSNYFLKTDFGGKMQGEILWFDQEKKFGFIQSEKEKELYFHQTEIKEDAIECRAGEKVEFKLHKSDTEPNKFSALSIHHPAGYKVKQHTFAPKGPVHSYLFQWSYIKLDDCDENGNTKKGSLHDLVQLALPENWTSGGIKLPHSDIDGENFFTPFPILRNYILYTFYKLHTEGKIMEVTHRGTRLAAFNTGLVDKLYDSIYALFHKNPRQNFQQWKFHSFCRANIGKDGQELTRYFNPLPSPAKYFDNPTEVIFNPGTKVTPRYDHIIYDGIRKNRYPTDFLKKHLPDKFVWQDTSNLPKNERNHFFESLSDAIKKSPEKNREIRNRIDDAIELAVKRVRWNFKTAIPIYYPEKNNICLLLPMSLLHDNVADLALVVGQTEANGYSGETIYKLEWAYNYARLVCRPDSNWLDLQKDNEHRKTDDSNLTNTINPPLRKRKTELKLETTTKQIKCPSCFKKYKLQRKKIGTSPKKVVCPTCGTQFIVRPD